MELSKEYVLQCAYQFILLDPQKWKKYYNLINSEKDASRTRAIEIFPYFSHQLSKKSSNKADAILIASFYYETYKMKH